MAERTATPPVQRGGDAAIGSGHPILNAGRGQPNWIASTPREAFFLLGRFAVAEATTASPHPEWGVTPARSGIADRLTTWLEGDSSGGAAFVASAVAYGEDKFGFDPDEWVFELVRGVLGDGYPSPNRMLTHIEKVIERYLLAAVGAKTVESGSFQLFATEGGAAAMAYVFRSLQENHLIKPGDKVAISTPIFTPYLQIPHLEDFGLDVIDIHTKRHAAHRFTGGVLDQLLDPAIKVFFVVNPGNPDSRTITADELHELHDLLAERRPDLIVVADTVYATFIDEFRGLVVDSPRNVICLHSFSKNYGATGSRLGFVAIHTDHVVDELLAAQGPATLLRHAERYRSLTSDVASLSFMSRLVADSREVALHDITGLATPDQVQMGFFALAYLMPTGRDYINAIHQELAAREAALFGPLGLQAPGEQESMYYALIDLQDAMTVAHGTAATRTMIDSVDALDVTHALAQDHGIVVQPGQIFDAESWDIRISLASLTVDELGRVGRAIKSVLDRIARDTDDPGRVVPRRSRWDRSP